MKFEKIQEQSIIITLLYILAYYSSILFWPDIKSLGVIIAVIGPLLTLIFLGLSFNRIEDKSDKTFWTIIFIGCLSYFIAELIYRFHVAYLDLNYPFPGWANLFYNLFVLLYAIAVLFKVYVKRKQLHTFQVFFDSFIIMTVLTTISWIHFLSPIIHNNDYSYSYFKLIASLSYPVAHLGVLLGIVLIYLSSKPIFSPIVLTLNITGIVIYTLAESYYVYQSIFYEYNQDFSIMTPVWNISLLFIGVSSLFYKKVDNAPQRKSILSKLSSSFRILFPYLGLSILVIIALKKEEAIFSVFIGGAIVLLLIVIRQVMTILQNDILLHQLKDRTKELESVQLELSASEQRYKSLFDHHPSAIYSIDKNGYILSANHSFEKITGYSVQECRSSHFCDSIVSDYIDLSHHNFDKALHGSPQNFDIAFLHITGKRIELNLTLVPIIVNNKVIGVYGLAQDITEKRKTEEMLMKSEKLSVVGRLAAGVAHEIRNPLTTIKGFLQLINIDKNSFQQEFLETTLSELARMEKIIYKFLYLADLHHETIFSKVNVKNLIQEIIEDETMFNINIIMETEEDIPPIECIESQLRIVFINLIENAIEATDGQGDIYIEVKQMEQNNLRIRFIDNGCGIPGERLHRLGEPYYSTKEKGTGIGLMLSYKIVAHHQGQLFISSEEGKGTTVDVTIPVNRSKDKNGSLKLMLHSSVKPS
jgi:PAS domain S-box-containing protein